MRKKIRKPVAPDERLELFEDVKDAMADYNFEWLAKAARVSAPTLYNWYNGVTRRPQLPTVVKVAKAMGFRLNLVKVGAGVTTRRKGRARA